MKGEDKTEFCTSRQQCFDRLSEIYKSYYKQITPHLTEINMPEAVEYEEQELSRKFWELGALDSRLKHGTGLKFPLFYNPNEVTSFEYRVLHLARYQF